jgi:hypothetical protein
VGVRRLPAPQARGEVQSVSGWVDANLIATLQRTIFRPFVRQPAERVPVAEMHPVIHRLRVIDPI